MKHFFAAIVLLSLCACGGGGGGSSAPSVSAPATPATSAAPVASATSSPTQASTATPAPGATPAPSATPSPAASGAAVNISLGIETQIFAAGTFGLKNAPDEHLSAIRQPDGTYRVFIASNVNGSAGSAALLSTPDFTTFAPLGGSGGNALAIFTPSAPGSANFDADYAAPGGVVNAANGTDLLMIYHGENHTFGGTTYPVIPFYAAIGLATSSDNGVTWSRLGKIISGRDAQPALAPSASGFGAAVPSAIVAGGFIYVFYTDYPVPGSATGGPGMIMVARSSLAGAAAPGGWQKFSNGSFSTPGIGGASTAVVPSGTCTPPQRQAGVSFNTSLNRYLLTFVCSEGWFVSTSSDLTTWTTPSAFFTAPTLNNNLVAGQEFDWYPTLITSGLSNSQSTGATGFVFYAKGNYQATAHTLYRRSFSIGGAPVSLDRTRKP